MKTITENSAIDKRKVRHYAYYNDDYGIATLVNHTGYLFVKEGQCTGILVGWRDRDLLLLGHVSTADQQWATDQAQGGLVVRCSQTIRS
jgi:hypothetical protein